jgi:hypothetical protein
VHITKVFDLFMCFVICSLCYLMEDDLFGFELETFIAYVVFVLQLSC